ncbi:MAG: pantetheine-phosphate adenylyltransferase [Acetobacter sp.]|nr:pantetheine-phosphate adenylyltransferase [Acetobacter sp.]
MKAMYAGSFDPFTLGHLSIVEKALEKYDKLIICISKNEAKTPFFSTEKRKKFIQLTITNLPRAQDISIITSNDLTVNTACLNDINTLVRGIRADSTDLHSEKQMAEANRLLAAARGFELNTDFIIQDDPFLQIVSSSLARSLLQMKEYIAMTRCLPKCISEEIIAQTLKPLFYTLFKECIVSNHYWELIKKTYTARSYHNLIHLAYMFNQLHIYKQCNNRENIPIDENLYLAIFLHDYIHNVQPEAHLQCNKQDSANTLHNWYKQQIFIPHINALTVYRLIMATTHNQGTLTNQQKLIADLDLSILGTADSATYKAYADGIRKEYAAYTDKEYKKGRLAFLFKLLKKKPLFHTHFFKERFEEQARKNITAEIRGLHDKS